MIERSARSALLRLASQFPVVGVTGPRQSGKTTLVRAAFPEKRYVSFDDHDMRSLARANPRDFLLAFPEGAIFDEAQKVPEIFDAVKRQVDQDAAAPGGFAPGKYVLTGSSQFRLKRNMTDSMAGRAAFMTLLPFAADELRRAGALPETLYDCILRGQYPPLHDPERRYLAEDWHDSYIDAYLERDVQDLINPTNAATFKKFVRVCALYTGRMLSMDRIARDVGVSAPTIKSWLSILETSYIIHLLEPDTNSLGRALVKTPKLYFVDSGLACRLLRLESIEELLLHNSKGALVETFAVAELLKSRTNMAKQPNLAYFRDRKGFEVDFIADWKRTFAIEVKSAAATDPHLADNVRKYLALRGDAEARGAVFHPGEASMTVNGVQYVGWRDWGTFLAGEK